MRRISNGIEAAAARLRGTRARRTIIVCVLIAQLAMIAFWTAQRSNYYIDEFFTFEYTHSFTFDKKDVVHSVRSESWQYEQWIDNAVQKRLMEVTEAESLLSQPPMEGLRMLLTRRNYYGLLNLAMAAFASGRITAVPAIVLNAVMFILAQFILYRIAKELTGSFAISAMTVSMYGFSAIAINMVLYVRFYMLVTLLMVLLLRLHRSCGARPAC